MGRTRLGPLLVASGQLTVGRSLFVVALGNCASVLAGYLFLALVLRPGGPVIMLLLTGAVLFALSDFVQTIMSLPPSRRRALRHDHDGRAR